MNNKKILDLLGLVRRAGCMSAGYKASAESVAAGKAKLIITSSDVSEKTKKEVHFVCTKYSAEAYEADFSMDELSGAIGLKAGVVSVNDSGFAAKIKQQFIKE